MERIVAWTLACMHLCFWNCKRTCIWIFQAWKLHRPNSCQVGYTQVVKLRDLGETFWVSQTCESKQLRLYNVFEGRSFDHRASPPWLENGPVQAIIYSQNGCSSTTWGHAMIWFHRDSHGVPFGPQRGWQPRCDKHLSLPPLQHLYPLQGGSKMHTKRIDSGTRRNE